MNVYRDASVVVVEMPFVDESGCAVAPSVASYRVLSADNAEVVATTSITLVPGQSSESITVSSLVNTLGLSERRALRTIEMSLTTPAGIVRSTLRYAIELDATVVIGDNSFQTFNEALLVSMDMSNLPGWAAATDRDKKSALIAAYDRLCHLTYRSNYAEDQSKISYGQPGSLKELTEAELNDLDEYFRAALSKAQVCEADIILGGDQIHDKRRIGLMSETVGETSNMFRPGKPLELPVDVTTIAHLSGYINWSRRVGRG